MAHLWHLAHVAKYGGIFSIALAALGVGLTLPFIPEQHEGTLGLGPYTTYSNLIGDSGNTLEDFMGHILVAGSIGIGLGWLIGRLAISQGWISEHQLGGEGS